MRYMIRLTSLTALLLAVLAGAALFWVSQQVQQVEREQRQLLVGIDQREESIRVLKAEWDYLNRPERLEELANKYLNMTPVTADTMIQSISAIPEPEEATSAPIEQAVNISTAIPAKAAPVQPKVALPPPTLNQNDVPQEEAFGKVLSDEVTGQ